MPTSADPGDLDVRVEATGGACTVTVTGDVDTTTAPVLADRLVRLLTHPGERDVQLDLRGVTFLDSAGLTSLIAAHSCAEGAGRVLRMRCGTSRAVIRPLEITGLTTVFTIIDR